jgi:FMN reductase
MPEPLTVLGLGGGLGARSRTGLLLRAALLRAREQGLRPRLYDVRKQRLPLYEPDWDVELPAPAKLLLSEARAADALILASPVYHGTVSGAFKNAVDYLQLLAEDDPPWLSGKAIGLLSVCTGTGAGMQAITAMDHMCRALRAISVPTVVVATENSFGTGNTVDVRLASRLGRMIGELRTYATASRELVGMS